MSLHLPPVRKAVAVRVRVTWIGIVLKFLAITQPIGIPISITVPGEIPKVLRLPVISHSITVCVFERCKVVQVSRIEVVYRYIVYVHIGACLPEGKNSRKALDLMNQNNHSEEENRRDVHQQLADIYDLVGDYTNALHHYSEGMRFAKNSIERAETLRKIGLISEKKGELKEALKFYEEAMDHVVLSEYPLEAGRINMNIGWLHTRNGNYESALDFCNSAVEIFRQEKDDYETALALNNLAVITEFHGQWDLAEKFNKESIKLIKKVGDPRKLGAFQISIGLLNWKRGKLKKSKKYFKKSLTLMETIGNTLGIASSWLNLGRVYTSEGDLQTAISCLEKCLTMFEKMGTKAKLCQTYIAFVELHIKSGDLEQAEDYSNKGMEIALKAPYVFDQGKLLALLGQIEANGNGQSETHFSQSIEILSSLGRKYELAVAKEQFGQARISRGLIAEGEKCLNDAVEVFKELGIEGYENLTQT